MAKTWTFSADSDSNPSKTYTTTEHDNGTRSCTCHGAKVLATGGVSCKHTRLIDQGLADQQAISSSGKSAWKSASWSTKSLGKTANTSNPQDEYLEVIVPQLLTPINEDQVEKYLTSTQWGAQEKIDGKRIILKVTGTATASNVIAFNRKGLPCTVSPAVVKAANEMLVVTGKTFTLDGEYIEAEDRYYAFDLLMQDADDLRDAKYITRYNMLHKLLSPFSYLTSITCVPLILGPKEKDKFLKKLRDNDREGIVFKKLDAHYTAGRGPDQIKFKFYATVTCMVIDHSKQKSSATGKAKSSISLGLYKNKKQKNVTGGILVGVGNCTIPSGWKLPPVSSFVEIRYLYAYKGGSLYQPTYLGVRDDVGADCLDDLKYKSEAGGSLGTAGSEPATPKPTAPAAPKRRVLWQ